MVTSFTALRRHISDKYGTSCHKTGKGLLAKGLSSKEVSNEDKALYDCKEQEDGVLFTLTKLKDMGLPIKVTYKPLPKTLTAAFSTINNSSDIELLKMAKQLSTSPQVIVQDKQMKGKVVYNGDSGYGDWQVVRVRIDESIDIKQYLSRSTYYKLAEEGEYWLFYKLKASSYDKVTAIALAKFCLSCYVNHSTVDPKTDMFAGHTVQELVDLLEQDILETVCQEEKQDIWG